LGALNSPIVIIGLGSQGKSWALNLRDSGVQVFIALRKGSPSFQEAQNLHFTTLTLGESDFSPFNIFLLLTPDHTHEEILTNYKDNLNHKSYLVYAHGYSYCNNHLKTKFPYWNHLLLAPKAIASEVRFQYETKGKLAAAYSTEGAENQKEADKIIFSLCKNLGINIGPFPVSFQEECFADLFSEQSLLCSILPYAASISFKKLRKKGISKEIAYLECWAELKLICDALTKMGPIEFFNLISPNALIGGEKAKNILFDQNYEAKLDGLMEDIWSRKFFDEVNMTDYVSLKKQVISNWENEELQDVHNKLGKELFSKP
jgi:ketol-acid reductoisomerase